MAKNNGSKDDKLIQSLYEKLNWFTYEATDEEFDSDQVQAIVKLLDTLDPLPLEEAEDRSAPKLAGAQKRAGAGKVDVDAAFERFKKKYNITEEELARKNGKPAAAPKAAEGEKIVPFRAEFSGELGIEGAKVRLMPEQGKLEDDGKDDVALAVGQTFAEDHATKQTVPVNEADKKEQGEGRNEGKAEKAAALADEPSRRRNFLSSGWGKVAVALIVVVAAGAVLSIGTSAVKNKPFLDVVRDGVNGFKVTVTGNEMEMETSESVVKEENDVVYYDSWEEVREENSEIMIPGYIPEGLELEELYKEEYTEYTFIKGYYMNGSGEELRFDITYYGANYAKLGLTNGEAGTLIDQDEENGISYFQVNDSYLAIWKDEKSIYTLEWTNLNDMDNIIKHMK